MQNHIIFEDESLRDGLQFEKIIVPLEKKIEIFNLLVRAGIDRIQVGSFVNPKVVPQMADTEDFISHVNDTEGVLVTGLVLNDKGLERAALTGIKHVSLSASASNSHSLKNVRKSSDDAIKSVVKLLKNAKAAGISVRAGIQCAFGCIYEGQIPEVKVLDIVKQMADEGAEEFNLADTTGMANPLQITSLVVQVKKIVPDATLSLHLHDTRGLGIANMVAGYHAGIQVFDTSVGGLGGCPFVKGAAGNVPTEDAVNLFENMGVKTGVDIKKICQASEYYEQLLGRSLPGRMSRVLKTEQQCA